jgi:hypothetical protein
MCGTWLSETFDDISELRKHSIDESVVLLVCAMLNNVGYVSRRNVVAHS